MGSGGGWLVISRKRRELTWGHRSAALSGGSGQLGALPGRGQGYHVAHPSDMRTRLMEGLSRSSREGRASPRGEWNSFLCSSRSLPSWELLQLLRLSTGERPESRREEGFWGCGTPP